MTRKVQIVRFWLFVALALTWMLLASDPSFGLIPVLFFPGQAGCFCCAGSDCPSLCTVSLDQVTIVLAGVANGTCSNCTGFNGTYAILDHGPSIPCFGQTLDPLINSLAPFDGSHACPAGPGVADSLSWLYEASGSNTRLRTLLGVGCADGSGNFEFHFFRKTLGTSPATCDGLSAVDVPFDSRTSNCTPTTFLCDTTSATMTVTSSP